MTQIRTMDPVYRGDSIEFEFNDLVDQNGNPLVLSNYSIRAALKRQSDTADNDDAALATITVGSGITVANGNDISGIFPATATDIDPVPLKFDIQLTVTATPTRVYTPLVVLVPMADDITKTSP